MRSEAPRLELPAVGEVLRRLAPVAPEDPHRLRARDDRATLLGLPDLPAPSPYPQ